MFHNEKPRDLYWSLVFQGRKSMELRMDW